MKLHKCTILLQELVHKKGNFSRRSKQTSKRPEEMKEVAYMQKPDARLYLTYPFSVPKPESTSQIKTRLKF